MVPVPPSESVHPFGDDALHICSEICSRCLKRVVTGYRVVIMAGSAKVENRDAQKRLLAPTSAPQYLSMRGSSTMQGRANELTGEEGDIYTTMDKQLRPRIPKFSFCYDHPAKRPHGDCGGARGLFVGGNAIQQEKVKAAVQGWVKYVHVKLTIRINFHPRSGSWSYVGNEVGLINANKITMDPGTFDTIAESEKGIILHEFSYTLGLMHGYQSPVRGGTITLKESGTYPCSILKSILMYFMPAAMNEQNTETNPTTSYPVPTRRL
ncbi:hypothetical protein K443DRAFT_12726 [Laccaria amethystina LaAM-08-1]|uniref:Uncharacterized protein n=1 Tax=Laccaria amethystina LaAM-08-1 TaxID=1095629 RepID=A0A0C9XBL4_9AGAR|nr:hypothetical protein K443DRAFT_12726 [Laccaria amethystina LaAM-08-1]